MKLSIKQLGAAALASILAADMIPAPILAASNDDAHPTEKTETVYTVLNQDGSVDSSTVSAWLHDDDGLHNVSESLDLKNVENVKGDDEPSVSGNIYTWNTSEKDIWYTGDADKQLPVSARITYELDGRKVDPDKLAGASGKLKITIHLTSNISEQTLINGRTVTIHPTFLTGGMMDVNTDHFKNVHCDQGKIVSDGTNEFLAFATVPGLQQSMDNAGMASLADDLNISDDIVISADVTDYEDGEIMMVMTNDFDLEELPNVSSISELTDGISQLYDASTQLEDGSKQLYEGTTKLKEGAAPLKTAGPQLAKLSQGADLLHEGALALESGIHDYTDGADALAAGTRQLYGINAGIDKITSSTKPSQGTQMTLANASASLSQGLKTLKSSVDAMDTNGTKELLENAKTSLTSMQDTLATDKQVVTGMQSELSAVNDSMKLLQAAGQAYAKAAENVNTTITADNEKIASANKDLQATKTSLKNSIASQKTSLTSSIATLSAAVNAMEEGEAKAQLNTQLEALRTQLSDLDSLASQVDAMDSLDDLQAIDARQITTILNQISQGMSTLNDKVDASASAIDSLSKDVDDSLAQIEALEAGMEKVQLPQNLDALKAGVDKLSAGADSLNVGVIALNQGLDQLNTETKSAIDQVNAGADKLTASNDALNEGASRLSAGTKSLTGSKDQLAQLTTGLDTLGTALDELHDGAKTLYEGNVKFVDDGTGTLKEKTADAVGMLDNFKALCDKVEDLNARYDVFAGAPEGAVTKTLYVFRTKEDKPEKTEDEE